MAKIEGKELFQLDLAIALSTISGDLSQTFTDGLLWHIKSPKFKQPFVTPIYGYDISSQLAQLGQSSKDLHVSLHTLEAEDDEDYHQIPCYVWEIYPPRSFSVIGQFITQCNQNRNLSGLGLTLYCPQVIENVTSRDLEILRGVGVLNVDILYYFNEGEGFYNPTKPESVLLSIIERDPIRSLETAFWILEGLSQVKDIHAEETTFEA